MQQFSRQSREGFAKHEAVEKSVQDSRKKQMERQRAIGAGWLAVADPVVSARYHELGPNWSPGVRAVVQLKALAKHKSASPYGSGSFGVPVKMSIGVREQIWECEVLRLRRLPPHFVPDDILEVSVFSTITRRKVAGN